MALSNIESAAERMRKHRGYALDYIIHSGSVYDPRARTSALFYHADVTTLLYWARQLPFRRIV